MKNKYSPTYYEPKEEKLNVITHAIGLFLSIIALIVLVIKASIYGTVWHVVSFSIYGVSLIVLYTASTLYHKSKELKIRAKLNIFDHASIYILIAGTYTPFTLVTLNGKIGWWVFGITWFMAVTGVILKLFFTGKYDKLSTIMYVLMGWIMAIVIKPLIHGLPISGVYWLFVGGVSYTFGAVLYSIEKLKYNHVIFHLFVLAGSFCHFISVYFYVLEV